MGLVKVVMVTVVMVTVDVSIGVKRGWFGLAHDNEAVVRGGQNLDRSLEQPCQGFRRDDLSRGARNCPAGSDIDDAIEIGQYRVDIVGDHDHRHTLGRADVMDQRCNCALIGKVEAVKGLIEEEEPGPQNQCLGDEEPLLFATRELSDWPIGKFGRPDERNDLIESPVAVPGGAAQKMLWEGNSPSVPVKTEPHDVNTAHAQRSIKAPALGEVADLLAMSPGRPAEYADLAVVDIEHAECHLDKR